MANEKPAGNRRPQTILIDPDVLLNEVQAAALLGMKPRTLQAWRQSGRGPAFVKVSSRAIRYRRRDLVAWVEAHLQQNTLDLSTKSAQREKRL